MKWQNVLTTFKQCFQQNFQWFMRCVFWSLSGHKEPQCCFLPSVPDASEFQACTEGKISCYWALNFYLLLSCFLLYLIFVSPPPPLFFSWAFTMLHFGRKSFHENQENCEIISQFTIYYLKGGRDGVEWSKTLIGIFCSTLHVFFLAFCCTCLTELCSFVYTCRWKDDSFTN